MSAMPAATGSTILHVVGPLPSGWLTHATCVEQFCHGGWLHPTSALVVSTLAAYLLMVRKSVPHVLGISDFAAQVLQDGFAHRFQLARMILFLGLTEIRHPCWVCCSDCAA